MSSKDSAAHTEPRLSVDDIAAVAHFAASSSAHTKNATRITYGRRSESEPRSIRCEPTSRHWKGDGRMSPCSASREWKVGDRCRVETNGEWRNATIVSLSFQSSSKRVALVVRDGDPTKCARFLSSLREPVDE